MATIAKIYPDWFTLNDKGEPICGNCHDDLKSSDIRADLTLCKHCMARKEEADAYVASFGDDF